MPNDEVLNKIVQALQDAAKTVGSFAAKSNLQSSISQKIPRGLDPKDAKIEEHKAYILYKKFQSVFGVDNNYYKDIKKFNKDYFQNLSKTLEKFFSAPATKQNISTKGNLTSGLDVMVKSSEDSFKVLKDIKAILESNSAKEAQKPQQKAGLFKNMAGFAEFALGVFVVVAALGMASDITVGGLIKATLGIGAFVLLFLQFGKLENDLKKASVSFAIFSGTLLLLVLPLLYGFAEMPFTKFNSGVLKLGLIVIGLIALIDYMSKIKANNLKNTMWSFTILSATIGFIILPMLVLLASMPWMVYTLGLLMFAGVVTTIFGLLKLMELLNPQQVLKSSAGIGLFGLVVGLLILPLLQELYETPWLDIMESLLKLSLVISAIAGIMFAINKIPKTQLLEGSIIVGIISLVLWSLSLALSSYANMDWLSIIKGLGMSMLAIVAFGAVVFAIGAFATGAAPIMAVGLAVVLSLSVIMGILSFVMDSYSDDMEWGNIFANLTGTALAMGLFGVLMAGLGVVLGLASPLIALATIVMLPLLAIMYLMANTMESYSGDYNWSNIGQNIAQSFKVLHSFAWGMIKFGATFMLLNPFILAGGLMAFGLLQILKMFSEVFDIMDSLSDEFDFGAIQNIFKAMDTVMVSFFGLIDSITGNALKKSVSLIAAFPILNLMFSLLGGISSNLEKFSEISDKQINFGSIVKDLNDSISPLVSFTNAFERFNKAYSNFGDISKKMDFKDKLSVVFEAQNGLQQNLLELQKRELEVQNLQLEQLKINGKLLEIIASNGRGSSSGQIMVGGDSNSENNIKTPDFTTKKNWLDHMSSSSMSFV